jgi:sugar (pentulose or hexulose) kinase
LPAIVIFDAGKTNKKAFVLDQDYNIIHEQSECFNEVMDEDGFPCEDLSQINNWMRRSLKELLSANTDVRAVNFTSYGASFVHLDEKGSPILPLYNYLKPYPAEMLQDFFSKYGGEEKVCRETASPSLGNLNSGLLLYRLKREKDLHKRKGFSLHLPQYLSYLACGKPVSDITSIGCHTMLWNFDEGAYHGWVQKESLSGRLAPLVSSEHVEKVNVDGRELLIGTGLHDSSSALIPYLASFSEPFVLVSTGTWSITLNPFTQSPLTGEELKRDCLCYLTYKGKPVKASRLFAGHIHDEGVKRLNAHYHKSAGYFQEVAYDPSKAEQVDSFTQKVFETTDLSNVDGFDLAYHLLVADIIARQVESINLVMSSNVNKIFVDGGFSRNIIYMRLLAKSYPGIQVYSAAVPQATALGAAIAIHDQWNPHGLRDGFVQVTRLHDM